MFATGTAAVETMDEVAARRGRAADREASARARSTVRSSTRCSPDCGRRTRRDRRLHDAHVLRHDGPRGAGPRLRRRLPHGRDGDARPRGPRPGGRSRTTRCTRRRSPHRPTASRRSQTSPTSARRSWTSLPARTRLRAGPDARGLADVRLARAAQQLVLDRGRVEPAGSEHDVAREPEVGELGDEALVALRRPPRAPPRPLPRRASGRTSPTPAVEQRRDVGALGPGLRTLGDAPPEPGREAGERARVAGGPGRARRAGGSHRRRSRPGARRRRACSPRSRPSRQSCCRERLQKCASPVSRVRRSASSSIQASISTRPSRASWTIAARSSGCITERHPHRSASSSRSEDEPRRVLVEDRGEQRRLGDLERLGDVARRCRRRPRR